jgi:sortase (surface protein transpeptidase)
MHPARHQRSGAARWSRLIPVVAVALLGTGAGIMVFALSSPSPVGGAALVPSTVTTVAPTATIVVPAMNAGLGGGQARSIPVRIRIPAIGVNAAVAEVGKNPDGSIQVPPLAAHNLAAWYRYGPTPGQRGAAVIIGHVDSYTAPSVFYGLKYMRAGETIYIALADGRQATFTVDQVQDAAKAHFPTRSVYGALPYPGLRLITCGGAFDAATRHYLDNIIVYAHLSGFDRAEQSSPTPAAARGEPSPRTPPADRGQPSPRTSPTAPLTSGSRR